MVMRLQVLRTIYLSVKVMVFMHSIYLKHSLKILVVIL
ncbi:unnamed protein product [Schistosoma mattheei]|uniref:Uncharacterized protein n=1 Tax=Schistosoma mattheei TaxID=31246 RepID=A0A183NPX9_9TREM|nr:unnamed protein product [Schistosoma mattheei]